METSGVPGLITNCAKALLAWGAAACVAAANGTVPLPELILLGQRSTHAQLIGVDVAGRLEFQKRDGDFVSVSPRELVRWSTPRASSGSGEVQLVDGTCIRLAASWEVEQPWSLGIAGMKVNGHLLGELHLTREQLQVVALNLPPDERARQRYVDRLNRLQTEDASSDLVLLGNGDVLTGTLEGVGGKSGHAQLHSSLGDITIPVRSVHGIAFASDPAVASAKACPDTPLLLVGLRNGSRLAASTLALADGKLTLQSKSLPTLQVSLADIVWLQGFGESMTYLSHMEPARYEHTPYLEVGWSIGRDRNVLGAPLRVSGKTFPKGLGLHSASIVSYSLDGSFGRFAATVAIDDAANDYGSAVVKVLLKRPGGIWCEAFASGVNRGGDPWVEVSMPLQDATELQLVVEPGEDGDERDYLDWLDARVERTTGSGKP